MLPSATTVARGEEEYPGEDFSKRRTRGTTHNWRERGQSASASPSNNSSKR